MISPEARGRLASLMDDRRLELGLRWREVAVAAGISYEALRDIRNGSGGIRKLSEHAIETGLRWEPGSVARILAGGNPVPIADNDDLMPYLLSVYEDEAAARSKHGPEPTAEQIFSAPWEAELWRSANVSLDVKRQTIAQLRQFAAEDTGTRGRHAVLLRT